MLIMAIFLVCFDIGYKTSFVDSMQSFLSPLTKISEYGLMAVRLLFEDPLFMPDDEIYIVRYFYSRDGTEYYVDVLCIYKENDAILALQKDVLGYSNDSLIYTMDKKTISGFPRFYDDSGNIVYQAGHFSFPYSLVTTYQEYLLYYERNPSKDGWNWLVS